MFWKYIKALWKKKGPLDTALNQNYIGNLSFDNANATITMNRLQALRDEAWQKARKYRFDPVIGAMHAEYLDGLNDIIKG